MRTIIYGAGAIGGTVAGHLTRAGYDVVLIERRGHFHAIREHGLRFISPTGTHVLRLPLAAGPAEVDFRPDDVVFLSVKGQDTEDALRALRAVVEDVPLFCFQNGVRNEEIASQYFPQVYGVMVRVGGVYITDGEVIVRRDPPGWLVMGRYPTGTDDLVEAVAANLRDAGFLVMVTPDVMPYKWGKLMLNLANAVGAITDESGGDSERIAEAARREARALMARAGVPELSAEELAQQWPIITEPPRGTVEVKALSSTWQSLARRQGTVESDFLNGEIVRLAQRLGTEAPINATLARITMDMAAKRELPGRYTPAQLAALVGLS